MGRYLTDDPSPDHLSFPTCHCRDSTFFSLHSCPCQPARLGEWWEGGLPEMEVPDQGAEELEFANRVFW